MKKFLITLACLIGFAFMGHSQEIAPNAIGLRLGGANGAGAEINYQRHLEQNNRLELGLGFRSDSNFNAFKLTGIYQWVWNIEGGFNWYAGPGVGIGGVNDRRHHSHHDDGVYALIAGDIGVEYNFDIPLHVFIDFRPEIGLVNYDVYDVFSPDFAIGVRYKF